MMPTLAESAESDSESRIFFNLPLWRTTDVLDCYSHNDEYKYFDFKICLAQQDAIAGTWGSCQSEYKLQSGAVLTLNKS